MLSAADQPVCARAPTGAVSCPAGRQKSWQEAAVWRSMGCRNGREPEVLVVGRLKNLRVGKEVQSWWLGEKGRNTGRSP